MKKILSLGLHLGRGIDNQKYLINKYQDYINDIYLGPPQDLFGNVYTTVQNYTKILQDIYGTNGDQYKKDLLDVCDFARSRNILIHLTVNQFLVIKHSYENLLPAINFVEKLNPDQICTSTNYIDYFKEKYPNKQYIRTFYENELPIDDSLQSMWHGYGLRNTYFWTHKQPLKKVNNRILINDACPIHCPGCISCVKQKCNHAKWIKYDFIDMESYVAKHAWIGQDINICENLFPEINFTAKVGSRIFAQTEMFNIYLDNLINGSIKDMIKHGGVMRIAASYNGLWNNAEYQCYDFSKQFDVGKFNEEKIKWWKQINPNITKY